MRILVLSDTHGSRRKTDLAIQQQPTAQVVIHLGDGADDLEYPRFEYPDKSFYQVCGNCDRCCDFPVEDMITIEGKRILFTHGHAFRVKYTLEDLNAHARSKGADIVLFGHTHQPMTTYEDGLYWMNPASLRDNHYGIIDITDKGIVTNLVKLRT
jgi:hypothetical protein